MLYNRVRDTSCQAVSEVLSKGIPIAGVLIKKETGARMDQELITQIIDMLAGSDDIRLEDMPEYKLYISQLEEFFDKRLGKGAGDDEERKTISKTMIQNYIKDGLLMPPEGKGYNRNHVVLLAMIYNLKSILSIKDIKKLLSPILEDLDNEDSSSDIQYIYEKYLSLKENVSDHVEEIFLGYMKNIAEEPPISDRSREEWDKLQLLLFVTALISEANTRKRAAEFIIDKYFKIEE